MRRNAGRRAAAALIAVLTAAAACTTAFAARGNEEGEVTGEELAEETAGRFFDALGKGDFALAGTFCTEELAAALKLGEISFGVEETFREQFGDFDRALAEYGLLPADAAKDVEAYLGSILVQNNEDAMRTVLSENGAQAYITGRAGQVGLDEIAGIDLEGLFTETLEEFKETQEELWLEIASQKDATERGAALLYNILPDYADRIKAEASGLEPEEHGWTMTVDVSSVPAVITALDLDLVSPQSAPAALVPAESLEFWNRSFYGWWLITEAAGEKADFDSLWYDCAVDVVLYPDGTGEITFWDEDTSRTEMLGEADVVYSPVGTFGSLVSTSGWLWGTDLDEGDWVMSTGGYMIEDLVDIFGSYDDGAGTFKYSIFIRPWGALWDDMEEEDRPYYYESWYLPLIEKGEELPDSFIFESEE